jgi:hypothetical protein
MAFKSHPFFLSFKQFICIYDDNLAAPLSHSVAIAANQVDSRTQGRAKAM